MGFLGCRWLNEYLRVKEGLVNLDLNLSFNFYIGEEGLKKVCSSLEN